MIGNAKALRNLFPLKDGSILDRMAIAKGLENLRSAYGELGYINFTPVPSTMTFSSRSLEHRCFGLHWLPGEPRIS